MTRGNEPRYASGTRGSALALAADRLVISATGRRASAPTADVESSPTPAATAQTRRAPVDDKSRWVDTIEHALLAGEIDLAVHSAKDVPGELVDGLSLLGAPARAARRGRAVRRRRRRRPAAAGAASAPAACVAPRSCCARTRGSARSWRAAATSTRACASSPSGGGERCRRAGGLHAIVLAAPGLQRLGREAEIGAVLDPSASCPRPARARSRYEAPRRETAVWRGGRGDHSTPTPPRA